MPAGVVLPAPGEVDVDAVSNGDGKDEENERQHPFEQAKIGVQAATTKPALRSTARTAVIRQALTKDPMRNRLI